LIDVDYKWILVAIVSEGKHIFTVTASKERAMFIEERFILSLTNRYGIDPISKDSTSGVHRKPAGS